MQKPEEKNASVRAAILEYLGESVVPRLTSEVCTHPKIYALKCENVAQILGGMFTAGTIDQMVNRGRVVTSNSDLDLKADQSRWISKDFYTRCNKL